MTSHTRTSLNQCNKNAVWDFWQRLDHAAPEEIGSIVRGAHHPDVEWHGSAPIDDLHGVDELVAGFWEPFLRSFPDVKREPYVFMGGLASGGLRPTTADGEEEWVSGCGYLTGTFANDWLGIPATGERTNIFFGQFFVMRDGKIAESYVMYDVLAVMRQAGFDVLPPAPGADGGKIPAPAAGDGVLLTEQDPLEGRKSAQAVQAMGAGLERYDRSKDGPDMSRMEQWRYWSRDMKWYGYSGIGRAHSLEEFEDFHQRNWLLGFGDRGLSTPDAGGRTMGFVGEGSYAMGGIWDTPFSHHHGDYAGIPATGKLLTIRDFDWWKRGENDLLVENWIPIDLIDLCRQMGVDLMERLQLLVDSGPRWGNDR